jgi:serine/threonine protein kinase
MPGGPSLEVTVKPGDVLAGKYRVERVLGAGGMGVVVAAHHLQLDTRVAIKFLLPGMLANREAVDRFAREARAAVRITSEHVARILDVSTLETGAPYMVMEYLEGGDLAAWLRERGPLPIQQAVEFVLHACVAVAEAHGVGIVHRDLKPANLFCVLRPDGQLSIKVLDFGISKRTDTGKLSETPVMSVTRTATILGSPLYMSPEQMQSAKGADAQSDIWALGVILYEFLTGRVPFDGEAATEIAVKVATLQPLPIRALRPEIRITPRPSAPTSADRRGE